MLSFIYLIYSLHKRVKHFMQTNNWRYIMKFYIIDLEKLLLFKVLFKSLICYCSNRKNVGSISNVSNKLLMCIVCKFYFARYLNVIPIFLVIKFTIYRFWYSLHNLLLHSHYSRVFFFHNNKHFCFSGKIIFILQFFHHDHS